ncbi:MAG TPA: sulfotransferase family protein [Cyclobacteriaceae bacterium]|nr:sulfotransferase family protein [Cyclobacteriaceae bacterium]
MKYLHLISGPRNISTALMYSFAQRSDTQVVDEPFYAVYLSKTQASHPGKDDVLKAQSSDEEVVKRELFRAWTKPVLFIKNMAHHIEVMSDGFLSKCINIFLIRDPKQLIASYAQVIEKVTMRDIGVQHEYELFEKIADQNTIVIDSGLLLQNPESVLKQACEKSGIKFEREMLHWKAGPKVYDGIWAPHWYANVHRSTGFEKQATSNRPLPQHLEPLNEEASIYYQKLLKHALKP